MAVSDETLNFYKEVFQYPSNWLHNQVIAKDMILKAGNLNSKQKEMLKTDVKQINWVYIITSSNSRVSEFVSEEGSVKEIDVINVRLNSCNNIKVIAKMLLSAIPKSVILSLEWSDELQNTKFVFAYGQYHKRRGSDNMLSVETIFMSEQFTIQDADLLKRYMPFDKQIQIDLKSLYDSIRNNFEKANYLIKTGNLFNGDDAQIVNSEIGLLEDKIRALTNQAQKEKQLNKRVAIVSEIRNRRARLENLKKGEKSNE